MLLRGNEPPTTSDSAAVQTLLVRPLSPPSPTALHDKRTLRLTSAGSAAFASGPQSPPWSELFERIGDDASLHLLVHGALFSPLANGAHLQVAGAQIVSDKINLWYSQNHGFCTVSPVRSPWHSTDSQAPLQSSAGPSVLEAVQQRQFAQQRAGVDLAAPYPGKPRRRADATAGQQGQTPVQPSGGVAAAAAAASQGEEQRVGSGAAGPSGSQQRGGGGSVGSPLTQSVCDSDEERSGCEGAEPGAESRPRRRRKRPPKWQRRSKTAAAAPAAGASGGTQPMETETAGGAAAAAATSPAAAAAQRAAEGVAGGCTTSGRAAPAGASQHGRDRSAGGQQQRRPPASGKAAVGPAAAATQPPSPHPPPPLSTSQQQQQQQPPRPKPLRPRQQMARKGTTFAALPPVDVWSAAADGLSVTRMLYGASYPRRCGFPRAHPLSRLPVNPRGARRLYGTLRPTVLPLRCCYRDGRAHRFSIEEF